LRIAFIGLGIMGLPMATNLVAAGMEVTGYNRSRPAVDALMEQGGAGADSIADAVTGAEVVITMLPDSPDVEDVYSNDQGVLASVAENTLLIDMSSIRPDTALRLHQLAGDSSLCMLDAPVSGGEKGAQDAALSIMVGGSDVDFDRARPVLELLGSTIVHVGGPGSGQTVKAANQLLVAGTIQLVAEALVFLDAHDVDLRKSIEVLEGGLAGSAILSRKGTQMIDGNFAPGFRVDLHHKDLGIYRDAARSHEVFSPVGAVVAELMGSLRSTGGGDLDHTALLAQVDELSGRSTWPRGGVR
jgi:2-hydroxy-3-oxopropionate reductase